MEMDRYIGRLLDNRYEILEVIGTGGMAVVYKARCHRLNRLVAVKILKDDFFQDEEFRRRFHAESQAVAMLSHPNIVSVYDVATSSDADYIVMELIDGITLKQYMEKKGVLNWKETLHFAIQIGKALDHAHSRGIIHRDIKPHNVMVLKNGSVKVTDFGIARVMSNSNSLTKEALGSVHYISPEQAKGGRVDNRSDLYSLGVVMYEMMTGRPPYDGESPVSVAIQHINGKPKLPSLLNPNIPGGLEQIIMRAMEQSPANRYFSASKMLYDMDEFRKNPTILFDYNNPTADMDAAARLSEHAQEKREATPPQRPPVNRPAPRAEQPRPRPTQKKGTSAQKAARRVREEIVEDETERSSKVATIAIVLCAVVAVIAVVVCVLAITNGAKNNMISVPYLVGMTEEQVLAISDLSIKIDRRPSSEYPAGQVMSQTPSAGSQIAKGGQIRVVISLGAEAKTATMANLTNTEQTAAVNYLTGLNLKLQIIPKKETSSTVSEGLVTRTEPAENETLTEGQTVYLYISSGPHIRMGKVPMVKGLDVNLAKNQLNSKGFENIELIPVDSDEEKNTVVDISVPEGEEMDVNTEIILYVSNGKGVAEKPPIDNPPPVVDPDLLGVVVTIDLPQNMAEDYVLSIWRQGDEAPMEEILIPKDAISRDVELVGKGVMIFDFIVNNDIFHTEIIDFELYRPEVPEPPVENPENPTPEVPII
ncbi:MAG: Stk1 family PASTA domain-containing Ser/Thr kinase [Ruminococcaceae bacterium]|nr:Stk1 family PASTA domain-containing Ser/Thr kinase [Oscillospiraceae bacterium]